MGFQCGIVGLPNVGKSTLFNALTQTALAQAENYPFCTIDPNVGVVPVPDPRLAQLAAIAQPEKIVPTTVEFVDIAGLVAGASQGEGLPAGHEELHARALGSHAGDVGRGAEYLLEVVEHQQHLLVAEVLEENFNQRAAACLPEAERAGNHLRHHPRL